MNSNLTQMLSVGGIGSFGTGAELGIAVVMLIVWSFVWKGLALWHSAKRGQPYWFIVFLLVNTVGILEIIYLFAILKIRSNDLFKNENNNSSGTI